MRKIFTTLLCLFLIVLLFAACGAPAPAAPPPPAAAPAAPRPPADAAPEPPATAAEARAAREARDADRAMAAMDASDWEDFFDDEPGANPLPILTPSDDGPVLVYTVHMSLQTTTFDAGRRMIENTVRDKGGHVRHEIVRGRDMRRTEIERSAYYTFMVPTENLAQFLVVMEDNFNLLGRRTETDDVTVVYRRQETNLADLREQEQRLLEYLENTDDIDDLIDLERMLSRIQSSIRDTDTALADLDRHVVYSTVHIQLYEVIMDYEIEEEPLETFGTRLRDAFQSGVESLGVLLIFFATVGPVLLALALLAVAGLLIYRRKLPSYRSAKKGAVQNPPDKTE